MDRPKPISREAVVTRALQIACTAMERAGMEIIPGGGPASEQEIKRFLMTRARRELIQAQKKKEKARTP